MKDSTTTLRFSLLNILIIVNISSLFIRVQSFAWHPLSSSNCITSLRQQRSYRPRHNRIFRDNIWLRSTSSSSSSTTTSLVSSAVDFVHLKYTEITTNLSIEPQQQQHHSSSREVPPVIFLHGLLGNKKNFISLGTSLAAQLQTPRRIIAVDLRNHGM